MMQLHVITFWAGLLISLRLCQSQDIIRLEYHIQEERGVRILVGNSGKDSGLSSRLGKEYHLLMFQPFSHGNPFISYFSINTSNGVIRTARNIDREEICPDVPLCLIKLSIAVYKRSLTVNSPTLLNILEVTVIIDDINDNSPTFPHRVVNLPVPENLDVNFQIETSVATDADEEGVNSRITYRLEPASDVFELSSVKTADGVEDLVITIKKILDREEKSWYSLMVVATDVGEDPKSGSVLVNIQVKDMNDNAPVFDRLNYSISVRENSNVKTPLLVVSASDRDEGENARLTYSLSFQVSQDIRDTFTIEANTGKIYSRETLDFEVKQIYQFNIVASDNGNPSKSNFAYVTIHVLDENDNHPEIQIHPAPGGDWVVENGSVGKFLAYIKVTDADSGLFGQVSCGIEDLNFILEAVDKGSSGIYKIKLNQALDREEVSRRDVLVTCQDGGARPTTASASFMVNIEDVNDNSPQFMENSLFGSVMENENADAYVMQVAAEDYDDGDNSRVTFSISSGKGMSLFSINSNTGVISTTQALDRESTNLYYLEITASDNGRRPLASSATATITILDKNDNPPKFRKQAFVTSIMENLPAGFPVGDISAYDPDINDNGRFVFSIVDEGMGSGGGAPFTINPHTGSLKSLISFDREKKSLYKFRVKVTHPSATAHYDITNVTVVIDDDNDHAPVVVKPPPTNRTFRCPFNATVGAVITVFSATDEDDPKLVDISYQIENTNQKTEKWPMFSIDSSGKLRLARQIRPQDVYTHSLEVIVKDGLGSTSRSSVVPISVIVEQGSEEAMRAFMQGSKTYTVIVIIIIAATLIVALVIIAVICLIRRIDKKRGPHLPPASTDVNNKMYQAAKWVSAVPVANEIGLDEVRSILDASLEKKKRKEVSFSIDDDDDDDDDDVDISKNKMEHMGYLLSSSLHKHQRSDGLPFQVNTNQGDFIVMNGLTTPDYSQHLYDSPASSGEQQSDHQFMEVRHAEDRYSDASSGDTGTSDSGRGGSEDEGRGRTTSSTDGEIRKFKSGRSLSPITDFAGKTNNKKSNNRNSLTRLNQQPTSANDSEDSPGSPTPLLPVKERRPVPRSTLPRSFGQTPDISPGNPQSAHSSPSSSMDCQATSNQRRQLHNSARLTLSLNDCDGPYRVQMPEQHQQLLKTFSSPHTAGAPRGSPSPAWKRAPGRDAVSKPTVNHHEDSRRKISNNYNEEKARDDFNEDVKV